MTLTERLTQINEESQKWMDEHPGSWAGMLTTDTDHWAEYGVYSAEQLDKYLDKEAQKWMDEYPDKEAEHNQQ